MAPVFYLFYMLCLNLSLLCVLFVVTWNLYWRGGFAWDGSLLHFNWHPVLMVSGLVILYGNAAVVYRIPFTWKQRKLVCKLVHAGMMFVALLLSVLGLSAVFDFHRGFNIPHLYSVHSWVGLSTVLLFSSQWILGLVGFLLPYSTPWIRSSLKPVHIWIGKVILVFGLVSCISGINEKLLLTLNGMIAVPYSTLPVEAVFVNFLGILIVAFGMSVFGILFVKKWQRPEDGPESTHLLLSEGTP
ncbi:lysosomal membrane ascorbate-dependent ferrireductase CYB561A3-like [Eucyclogobius newberryi]|uniref:lysosomal membrane ascorbate-dependent ferrireductase CYB561A3-like n=1 Tax=Eucyclogobius newberryi TaxID=166745 RepID=UPI003B5C8E2D